MNSTVFHTNFFDTVPIMAYRWNKKNEPKNEQQDANPDKRRCYTKYSYKSEEESYSYSKYNYNNSYNETLISDYNYNYTSGVNYTTDQIDNNFSEFDVQTIILKTRLAEKEQMIINLQTQYALLNKYTSNQQILINELILNEKSEPTHMFHEYNKQKNMNYRLNKKYNELYVKYAKLQKNNIKLNNKCVKEWNIEDVICWIMNLDNGKYEKYKHAIIPNIINKQINGFLLLKMDLKDIANIGIHGFVDQQW
eukprot:290050_1